MIIVVEGPNGCGKTTFINQINKYLDGESVHILNIKEHTSLPNQVINKIKSRNTNEFNLSNVLYIGAAHLELLEKAQQLSAQGKIVCLDRSIASYFVYQCILYDFYGLTHISDQVNTFIQEILLVEFSFVYSIYMDYPYHELDRRLAMRGDAEHLLTDLPLIVKGYQEYFHTINPPSFTITDQSSIDECLTIIDTWIGQNHGDVYVRI